nr:restriction endonuclease subunit S [Weissella paramesenteroides]
MDISSWEKRKLGELAIIQGGGTPSSINSDYWNGNINWFTPTEVSNTGYVKESARKITNLGLKKSSAKLLPKGTVLMTSRAGVGDMGILTVPAATNQGFQSMIPNEEMPSYFLYSMQSFISKEANRLASGSTFSEISGKQVSKIVINVPSEKGEKVQIGKLFEQLNNLITVNQRATISFLPDQNSTLSLRFHPPTALN